MAVDIRGDLFAVDVRRLFDEPLQLHSLRFWELCSGMGTLLWEVRSAEGTESYNNAKLEHFYTVLP